MFDFFNNVCCKKSFGLKQFTMMSDNLFSSVSDVTCKIIYCYCFYFFFILVDLKTDHETR